ncbi:MAG: DUF5615 family PIN-like protein [Nitrospirae bacterium]|nr:DUF5615 family PIN-like protein [Nitrospirota bacterium]
MIEAAKKQKRIIITADLDYPQILALSGASSPGVILFRGASTQFKKSTLSDGFDVLLFFFAFFRHTK